jgi:hypothetical protein
LLRFWQERNQECVDMKSVQKEIHQTYGTRPDLAPHCTLFCLLEEHDLGRLAKKFMEPRHEEWDEHDEHVFGGNHEYFTYIPHLRPGRKLLAGPGCKPILLNQCWRCKKIKDGIEDEYCNSRQCAYYHYSTSTCRACTRYRTCAVCARERCHCRFVNCCVEDCPNLMCRCLILGEWSEGEGVDDQHTTSCGFMLDPDNDDVQYCQEHKPDGAQPQPYVPRPMPYWRMGRG